MRTKRIGLENTKKTRSSHERFLAVSCHQKSIHEFHNVPSKEVLCYY